MGSSSAALNGSGTQQVWVYTALSSQDINGNYSQYYGEVRYYGNGYGSWADGRNQYWSANFNGQVVSGSWVISYASRNDSYTVLWTGYYNIGHAADGTMGGFGVSATIDTDHTSIGDGTTSFTEGAAPTIPRASTPSFVGGPSLTTGTAVTIDTNRASASFTHNVSWSFGSLQWQTTGFSASTGIGASFTWTPPESMLAQIPNSASGSGTLNMDTYSGATLVGGKSIAFTLTAAASVKPTVSSVTLAEQNATVSAQVGAYVQSLSILKGTVNSAGIQGSTIASTSWSISGTSAASGSNIVPTTSGSVAVGGAATDSRARVGTYSANISVMPYVAPKINSAQARRALSSGVPDDNGTYIRLDLNTAVQSLIVGSEKNSLIIKVFTRLYGTSPWTARNSFTHTAVSYNTNVLITGGAIFPANQSFDVKIEVTDKFNAASPVAAQMVVSTAAIFMHWSQTGVGVGKYHEKGTLDVKGTIYADDVSVTGGYTPITVTDWNTAMKAGFYGSNNSATNVPFAWWWQGMVVQNGGELFQTVQGIGYDGIIFTRRYSGGTWGAWTTAGINRGTTQQRNDIYNFLTGLQIANLRTVWYNTDYGWFESYYVPTGTAGLGVTGLVSGTTAGWYPIGLGPECQSYPSAAFGANGGGYIQNWNGTMVRRGTAGHFGMSSGGMTIGYPGYYELSLRTNQQPGGGVAEYSMRLLTPSVAFDVHFTGDPLSSSFWTPAQFTTTQAVTVNSQLVMYVMTGSLAVHQGSGAQMGLMSARYLRPLLVSE